MSLFTSSFKKKLLVVFGFWIALDVTARFFLKEEVKKRSGMIGEALDAISNLKSPISTISFGDSVLAQIDRAYVQDRRLERDFLPIATNSSSKIYGHYFMLKRYLEQHHQLGKVVIGEDPWNVFAGLYRNQYDPSKSTIFSNYISFSDMYDMFEATYDPEILGHMLLTRFSIFYQTRYFLREKLRVFYPELKTAWEKMSFKKAPNAKAHKSVKKSLAQDNSPLQELSAASRMLKVWDASDPYQAYREYLLL